MGLKLFNNAAFLDFQNVIVPNGSNSESELGHFGGVVMLKTKYQPFTVSSFTM